MTIDKYKMVQDLADGWREKYEDAKQQLVKAQRAIDEHTYWKAKALDLEVKRDIAVSTLEKVKVDRATAQKALAAQCEETKKLRAELVQAKKVSRDAIPDGWALVPKEPTKEMMQAGFDVRGSHLYGLTYRAMLAAAPKGEE